MLKNCTIFKVPARRSLGSDQQRIPSNMSKVKKHIDYLRKWQNISLVNPGLKFSYKKITNLCRRKGISSAAIG